MAINREIYDIEKIPQRQIMDLSDSYLEEDLFPKIFADYEERDYGILFYDEDNKDSFDSNHAVIYKDKTEDLQGVLSDIVRFYSLKGIRPIIYQSMTNRQGLRGNAILTGAGTKKMRRNG